MAQEQKPLRKVTLAELASPAHVIRPLLGVVLASSLHVKNTRDSFGICSFRGLCIREYDF